jgi:hypothetical protein
MAFADVKTKIVFHDYANAADTTAILGVVQDAYTKSATFQGMVDSWLATAGHTIDFFFQANAFSGGSITGVPNGIMQVDVNALSNRGYVDNNGNTVLYSLEHAVVHELGHALTGKLDNYNITTPDYKGDNVVFTNKIFSEIGGIPLRNSYIAAGKFNDQFILNYAYTNGAAIDDSVRVVTGAKYSLDGNFNSANSANTKDLLIGDLGNNKLESGGGDDFLFGGGGDDKLIGGAGKDTAIYLDSNPADYDIRLKADGSWDVRDVRGAKTEGDDNLQNMEVLQFDRTQHSNLVKGGLTFETDLVFVVDTTGSMAPYIDGVKAQANAIIAALFNGGKTDARIAIESFKDTTNGEPSTTILKFTDQDSFADRQTAAINAINSLSASGGGDIPETDNDGLIHALNGDVGLWRSGAATKEIILFTDAPVKDTALEGQVAALAANPASDGPAPAHLDDAETQSFQASLTDPISSGLDDDPSSPDPTSSTPPPFVDKVDPITAPTGTSPSVLFAIQVGTDSTATASLKTLATTTGGTYLDAPSPADLIAALLHIITTPPVQMLTKGVDTSNGGPGGDNISVSTNTLSAGDQIDGGGGTNSLTLVGGGIFNLSLPTALTNFQVVNAQEGQAANGTIAATNQSITLRPGLNVTVNVAAATLNSSNPKTSTITINGANDASVINLGSGNDIVTVGGINETVNGGTGNNQIQVTAATIGAKINGGTGNSSLIVLGGGTNVAMGTNVTNISTVLLASAPGTMTFIANGISGLTVNDMNKGAANTVTAGGLNQTLTGGAGAETFVGFSGGSTTFKNTAGAMNGDTIANFFAANSQIDLTDLNFLSLQEPVFTGGKLQVTDGTHTALMSLTGTAPAGTFVAHQDSGIGTLISYQQAIA